MQVPEPPRPSFPRSWPAITLATLILSLLVLLPSAALAGTPSRKQKTVPDRILHTEMILFERINQIRITHGLPPFEYDLRLHKAARAHARDMQGNWRRSHRGSDGSTPRLRIQRTGYVPRRVTEAIGWGFNMDRMINWWLNSPVHRRILLSKRHEQLGVGYAGRPNSKWGTNWWVLDAATHY